MFFSRILARCTGRIRLKTNRKTISSVTMTELNQEVYQQERVKDELNEKLNEIFEDLDGTTKH